MKTIGKRDLNMLRKANNMLYEIQINVTGLQAKLKERWDKLTPEQQHSNGGDMIGLWLARLDDLVSDIDSATDISDWLCKKDSVCDLDIKATPCTEEK